MGRMATLGVLIVLFVIALGWAYGGPTDAQDRTDERLTALETQVADVTERVDWIEARVMVTYRDEAEADEPPASHPSSSGGVQWSGSGIAVSDAFRLSPGRYRASATVTTIEFAGFACVLYGPDDYWELVFNEVIDGAGTWTGESVIEVDAAGEYYLEVSNTTADWSLVLNRL